jgi:hypothetical protein
MPKITKNGFMPERQYFHNRKSLTCGYENAVPSGLSSVSKTNMRNKNNKL